MKKFFKNTFRIIGALLALAKGIMILGMIAVAAMTVYLIYITSQVTINQYNETLAWQNTAYDMPLAEIEPALVANTLDTDIVAAATAWEDLDDYMEKLNKGEELDRQAAEEILDAAVKWQGVYGLESDSITRLSLYLKLEDAITDAYATLDTTELAGLAEALYNLELEEKTAAGQQYMERLKTVTADFSDAKDMMADAIGSVGTVENGVWTIPYTYTRTDLTDALERIQAMQKFPDLGDAADVLSDIAVVLNYNKNARDYFEFQDFMEKVNNTTRSDYIAVSSIYTYGQALSFGYKVNPRYQEGYTISMDSPVTGVYHDGERLDSYQYIRKGADITVEINEIYEPIPVEEPVMGDIAEEEIGSKIEDQIMEGEVNDEQGQ